MYFLYLSKNHYLIPSCCDQYTAAIRQLKLQMSCWSNYLRMLRMNFTKVVSPQSLNPALLAASINLTSTKSVALLRRYAPLL